MKRQCLIIISSFIWFLVGIPAISWAQTNQSHSASQQKKAMALITAARAQIGTTRIYDGAYIKLAYPNGDVSPERGVCTDVVIRAFRKAFGYDLQKTVHEDMNRSFKVYPTIWGLTKPDSNIDHRRVPNLQTFFKRQSAQLTVSNDPAQYQPGDIVTQMIGNKLPHIVIVSNRRSADGKRPLVIHNIGDGTQEEDRLFSYPITGHYRFLP